MPRPRPYIGVTGFMSRWDVGEAIKELFSDGIHSSGQPDQLTHDLMVGVLASSKTLAGQPSKWPNRYPRVDAISKLFPPDRRTLNLIHYATNNHDTLGEQLLQLVQLGGPWLDGFQLNVAWPDAWQLQVLRGKRLVLQLGNRALQEENDNPGNVVYRLMQYQGIITDVLIDMSGGKGIPLDPINVLNYVRAIAARYPDLGVTIAGGLSADTLELIQPIVTEFPWISFDAEGKLRTPQPEDQLILHATRRYLHGSRDLCSAASR